MKVLSIISIVICSIGLLGGVVLLTEQEFVDALLALVLYGYFMIYSIKVMMMLEKGSISIRRKPETVTVGEDNPSKQVQ